jgi:hypothetical protein
MRSEGRSAKQKTIDALTQQRTKQLGKQSTDFAADSSSDDSDADASGASSSEDNDADDVRDDDDPVGGDWSTQARNVLWDHMHQVWLRPVIIFEILFH